MDRRQLKFFILGSGVVLSMAFLIWAGMDRPGGFVYYLTVTEFLEQPSPHEATGCRVNGRVVEGTIVREPTGDDVSFVMSDGVTELAVRYRGVVPDTFVDDAEVVVEGSLQPDRVFSAHTMLAKCPSKYESADDYDQKTDLVSPDGTAVTAGF